MSISDKIEIMIDNRPLLQYDDLEISKSIDAISKASFVVPNEQRFRDIFKPFVFSKVIIKIYGKKVFSGFCSTVQPSNDFDTKEIFVACNSRAGIVESAYLPLSAFPKEYIETTIDTIIEDICRVLNIGFKFMGYVGAPFERVDLQPGQDVFSFITDLARQRGFLITDDEEGDLVIYNTSINKKIFARYEKGGHPCEDISMNINFEQYYSSITGFVPDSAEKGKNGGLFEVKNPFNAGINKPYVEELRDIDASEIEPAVKHLAGRMLGEICNANVLLSTLKNANNELVEPYKLIVLKSPEDYIKNFYTFLIADVTYQKSSSTGLTASLKCVLPAMYTGEIPEVLPWQ